MPHLHKDKPCPRTFKNSQDMNKKQIEIVKKQFGENIFDIRNDKALSLRNVAGQCDLDNSKISKIEKGKVNVSLSTLVELAHGLKVRPSALLKGAQRWLNR
jgi:ribosome-binding protein aMBF1 (putative translation factor)